MRQGIVVTSLLCLIAIATVLLTDGWNGLALKWPERSAAPAAAAKPPARSTAPGNALAAAAAFAEGARRIDVGTPAGGRRLLIAARPAHAAAPTADDQTFAAGLQTVEASIKTANVGATNIAVSLDYNAAIKWYALADDPANAEARYGIARDFASKEPDPDFDSAARWLLSAAELGHARAQLDLAAMYMAGEGVERDYRAAFMWSSLAGRGLTSETDKALAADMRDRLARAMTPDERAAADAMIRERLLEIANFPAVAADPNDDDLVAALAAASPETPAEPSPQ
jgi:hypothetical protein